jgi:hypothetical protein
MTAFSITSSIDKPVGDFTKVPKDVFASINKDANTLDQILNKIKEIAPSVTLDDFSLTNSLETSDPTTDIST